MQSLAAAIGLAPPILIARPDEGLLVTRHAAGRMLTRADFRDTAMLVRVGAWLARLHAGTPPAALAVVDFGERAAGYLATMQAAAATPATAAIAEALAARRAALPEPARLAPCHHDLHHRNFVDTPAGLVAIDWEYAGPGDPAADLASCIGYHDLGPREIDALLAGYGAAAEDLRERLATARLDFRLPVLRMERRCSAPQDSRSTARNRRGSRRACSAERLHGYRRIPQDARPMS